MNNTISRPDNGTPGPAVPSPGVATKPARRWRPLAAASALLATVALTVTACSSAAQPQDLSDDVSLAATVAPTSAPSPEAVGLSADPSADPSKASFPITSSTYTIKGDGTLTVRNAACASGFYVRPTPPPALQPTNGLSPAISLSVSNGSSHVYIDSTTPGSRYGQGNFAPFSSFTVKFGSDTPYSHTLSFTWWCDAIAPWMTFGDSSVSAPANDAAQITPPTPSCAYCTFEAAALTNDSTGLVLNNSGNVTTEGNPIITWPNTTGAPNQAWNFNEGGFLHGIPTYALWLGAGSTISSVVQENASSHLLTVHNSQGSVPAGGNWYYLDTIPGPNSKTAGKLDVMIVNTDTNQCLAGPAQQGTQVQTEPCNATDKAQWWTITPGSR